MGRAQLQQQNEIANIRGTTGRRRSRSLAAIA